MGNVELFVEGGCLDEHLHEYGVGFTGLSGCVVLFDVDDVLVEMSQDVCS